MISRRGSRFLGALLLGASLIWLSGCTPRKVRSSTQLYILDVRHEADNPRATLRAIDLTGEISPDHLATTVGIPSAAAALPGENATAEGETAEREVFRLESTADQLTIEKLGDQDLLMVLAAPREELMADLQLLARLRDFAFAPGEAGPGVAPASSEALQQLTSPGNLERAAEAAAAERRVADLGRQIAEIEEEVAALEDQMAARRESLEQGLDELEAAGDDVAGTRELRHRLARLDLDLKQLEADRRDARESLLLLEERRVEFGVAGWRAEELAELRALVDNALEAQP